MLDNVLFTYLRHKSTNRFISITPSIFQSLSPFEVVKKKEKGEVTFNQLTLKNMKGVASSLLPQQQQCCLEEFLSSQHVSLLKGEKDYNVSVGMLQCYCQVKG